MPILYATAALAAIAALTTLHRYVWWRLVRDTMRRHSVPWILATFVFVTGPLLAAGATAARLTHAPFRLQQVLSWPGYLWAALFLYLTLALLTAEVVRPLLLR
ncbi:hypothetical protein [Streptomyces sp. NBC_01716]|uniref:hypothetical protein n=1 Tax=Streptomyces sp. NBC_01716 TaxID=2975917 RepID=UPI002E302AF5|nr:hypothetical protein [Streptomyces sp. NBC_01716]